MFTQLNCVKKTILIYYILSLNYKEMMAIGENLNKNIYYKNNNNSDTAKYVLIYKVNINPH